MRSIRIVFGALLLFAPVTPAAEAQYEHNRDGFWFNVGLGYGSLGCSDCGGREGGLAGAIALGGTLSDKVILGAGLNGWSKSESDITLTVGTLAAVIRVYPSATGGFFLLGGAGIGFIELDLSSFGNLSETGFGGLLGLGYDIRVGNNLSITPFWNAYAVVSDVVDANVAQIGLGLTVH